MSKRRTSAYVVAERLFGVVVLEARVACVVRVAMEVQVSDGYVVRGARVPAGARRATEGDRILHAWLQRGTDHPPPALAVDLGRELQQRCRTFSKEQAVRWYGQARVSDVRMCRQADGVGPGRYADRAAQLYACAECGLDCKQQTRVSAAKLEISR